jgi:hypothetical protein
VASEAAGFGGCELFSGAHLMGHIRAVEMLKATVEESKAWRQVSFGGLQLWHHHDRQVGGGRGGGAWWRCTLRVQC